MNKMLNEFFVGDIDADDIQAVEESPSRFDCDCDGESPKRHMHLFPH